MRTLKVPKALPMQSRCNWFLAMCFFWYLAKPLIKKQKKKELREQKIGKNENE